LNYPDYDPYQGKNPAAVLGEGRRGSREPGEAWE
jgi:hypothetical protein